MDSAPGLRVRSGQRRRQAPQLRLRVSQVPYFPRSFGRAARSPRGLREWGPLFACIDVGLAIRSDSTVALSVLDKEASSSPALNSLAAEISLLLESYKIGQVTLQHIPGKLNKLADFLSRPKCRGDWPTELAEVKTAKPKRLGQDDFRLGTPGSHDASAPSPADMSCARTNISKLAIRGRILLHMFFLYF